MDNEAVSERLKRRKAREQAAALSKKKLTLYLPIKSIALTKKDLKSLLPLWKRSTFQMQVSLLQLYAYVVTRLKKACLPLKEQQQRI